MTLMASATLSLLKWHEMIAQADLLDLEQIIAKETVFRLPVANKSCPGQTIVGVELLGAMTVFEDFANHRSFVGGDRDVCLELSARIDDKDLEEWV